MRVCAAVALLMLTAVSVTSCSKREATNDEIGQAAITVQEPRISSAPGGQRGPDEAEPVAGPVGGPAAKGVPSPYPATAPRVPGEAAEIDAAGQPPLKVQLPGGPGPVAKQGTIAPKAESASPGGDEGGGWSGGGMQTGGMGKTDMMKKMMMTKMQKTQPEE